MLLAPQSDTPEPDLRPSPLFGCDQLNWHVALFIGRSCAARWRAPVAVTGNRAARGREILRSDTGQTPDWRESRCVTHPDLSEAHDSRKLAKKVTVSRSFVWA